MKKLSFIIVAIMMLGFANQSVAQSNAVKLNIFSLAISTYNVSFERAINDNNTAQLNVFYLNWGKDTKFTGVGITPEFRIYFDEALSGFYVAPFLRYQNYTLKATYQETDTTTFELVDRTAKGTLQTFGGGLIAGHQWLLGEHFTIDVFLGPSYNAGSIKAADDSDDPDYEFSGNMFDGFGIRWGLTFGFAF